MTNPNSIAALNIITPHLEDARTLVLNWLRDHPNATGEEIDKGLGDGYNTHHKRLPDLEQMGLVRRSGKKKVTKNGRCARPRDTWLVIENPTNVRPFDPKKGASFAKSYRGLRAALEDFCSQMESLGALPLDAGGVARKLTTVLSEFPNK